MIRLSGIRKSYRTDTVETLALRGIDLEVERGDYIAIVGPSGCGKSTLLNILGLLDASSAGRYEFSGQDVAGLSFDERAALRNKRIGFVFQSFHLLPDMSVLDNVQLPTRYAQPKTTDSLTRARELLELVGLEQRADHRPSQLSGGQQQRVAIARALMMEPDLLLLDEPTGNLDLETSQSIMDLVDGFNQKNMAIVLVTHDSDFARRAKRVLRVSDGRVEGCA